MPEKIYQKEVFSLLEVTQSIQRTLSGRYKSSFWVKAEMNKLNFYKQSGHCYPDLLEKKDGKVVAQIKGLLWKEEYKRIDRSFLHVLKEPLKDGIKILFEARITFDPLHGLALLITDIDPSYTLGDLERERQETLKRLRDEGIFERNKSLELPVLPKRIAIISVESSKGYADFLKVIGTNPWNYRFFHLLFPSLLQGEKAVDGIIAQLKRIEKVKRHFDVVAIIRGGGGDVGLSCYDNYRLAREIALFPIPVMTGIGHATNETVAEMVSFANAITPTKLAEYLLQKFHDFAFPVEEARKKVAERSKRLLGDAKTRLQSETKLFRSVSENILTANRSELKGHTKSLLQQSRFVFNNENGSLDYAKRQISKGSSVFLGDAGRENRNLVNTLRKDSYALLGRFKILISGVKENLVLKSGLRFKSATLELNSLEKNVANMSPENVLKRGYSITLLNGKAIKSSAQVKPGDIIHTAFLEGEITSIVNQTEKGKK